jgi:hypothetical protein
MHPEGQLGLRSRHTGNRTEALFMRESCKRLI